MSNTIKLQAEAPSFTPSFAILSKTVHSNVDGDLSTVSDKNRTSTYRKNRNRNQRVWRKSWNSLGDGGLVDALEKHDVGKQKNSSKRSKQDSKNLEKQKNEDKARTNQINKRCLGRNYNKRKGCGESEYRVAECDKKGKESLCLPLDQESAFPSLGPFTGTSAACKPSTNLSSIWQNSRLKNNLLYVPSRPDRKGSSNEIPDVFEGLGLQKLSSEGVPARRPRRSQYSSWTDDYDNCTSDFVDSRASTDGAVIRVAIHVPESAPQSQLLQEWRIRNRRPPWDMKKMRDKWWDALDYRTRKRNFLVELQASNRDRIVDLDTGHTSSDEESTSDAYINATEVPKETQSIMLPSPTPFETLLMDHPENTLVSSQDEIIDRIIRTGDSESLDRVLDLWQKSDDPVKNSSRIFLENAEQLMQRLVNLDKPDLLVVVLNRLNNFDPCENGGASVGGVEVAQNFMTAAELGQEGCLSIFLTKWDDSMALFSFKDDGGNNVIHHCCCGQGSASALQILLRHISGATKSKQQQLSKTLLTRNNSSQNALHLACARGKVDFVETFLSLCSTALLAKLLAMEDDRSQTPLLAAVGANASDVVMCLIMWRRNRNLLLRTTPLGKVMVTSCTGRKLQMPPCPMVWAAKHGNLDIIQLLLQFGDPSGKNYQVTESIVALLLSENATSDIKAEGCHLLVHDGGNPFSELVVPNGISGETAVSIAAKRCSTQVLNSLVLIGLQELQDRQQERRRDPKLRQQPESFFRGMECKENFEKERALANALVESLYRGWVESGNDGEGASQFLSHAVSLYMLGAELKEKDRARLHVSMKARELKPVGLFAEEPNQQCYISSYFHQAALTSLFPKIERLDRSALSLHSELLLEMEWFHERLRKSSCSCPWLSDWSTESSVRDQPRWKDDEVVLITDDGTAFTVHDSIISAKSAKLASALRFASMTETMGACSSPGSVERVVRLDVPSKYCAWMLEHIYHGSIGCGWSRGREQTCHEILELMLVAEEYLCTSLLQECEMRLLSANPTECFCWSCARSVRFHAKQEKTAECLYFTCGPSRLLTGTSVLDVLAVLQHLDGIDCKYQISHVNRSASWLKRNSRTDLWNHEDCTMWSTHKPLRSLKSAAISTILSSFPQVINSSSFLESVIWNNDNANEDGEAQTSCVLLALKAQLLQMCLQELSLSELPKVFERYQKASKPPRTSCQ